jgi:MG2 domain
MKTCDSNRELIWDDLFGLLEPAASEQLHAHLEDCAVCRSELGTARMHHDLVVEAARLDIDVPLFQTPVERPEPMVTADAILPGRRRAVPRWSWAAAAAVLLLCAVPYGWYRAGLHRTESAYLAASDRVQQTIQKRSEDKQQAELAARSIPASERSQHLQIEALGPAVYQPGAADTFRIAVQDLDGKPVNAPLRAQLTSGSQRLTLASRPGDRPGEFLVRLPDALSLPIRAPVHLNLEAQGSQAPSKMEIPLGVQEPTLATALRTDRTWYRPGDRVFFSSLTLERFSRKPPSRPVAVRYSMVDSQRQVVQRLTGQAGTDGTGAGVFTVGAAAPPGRYTLLVSEAANRFPPATCYFQVGSPTEQQPAVPSNSDRLSVDFFPESGELIAGVPNRVYFRVRDARGEPVRAEGRVMGSGGQLQAERLATREAGLGVFTFTPKAGQAYRLELSPGTNRSREIALPRVESEGVVISVPQPVSPSSPKLDLVLFRQGPATAMVVGVSCRGRIVAQQEVPVQPGRNEVELHLAPDSYGVLRVAAYEQDNGTLQASAERLAYRYPGRQLRVAIHPQKHSVVGGEQVALDLHAVNEKGQAEPVTYSIRAVIPEAGPISEKSLRTQFDLLSELPDPPSLADPGRLLEEGTEAAALLDLVLGSQRLPFRARPANTGLARGPAGSGRFGRDPWAASLVRLDNQIDARRQYAEAVVAQTRKLEKSAADRDNESALEVRQQVDEARALWLDLQSFRAAWAERWRVAFVLLGAALCTLAAGMVGLPALGRMRGWKIGRAPLAGALGSVTVCFLTLWLARTYMGEGEPGIGLSAPDALAMALDQPLNVKTFHEIEALASKDLKAPAAPVHLEPPRIAVAGPAHPAVPLPSVSDYSYHFPANTSEAAIPATLCWKPSVDASDGHARVTFDVPGNRGKIEIQVEAHSPSSGRLGAAKLDLAR